MARSRDDHLWTLAHTERTALAQDLSGFDAEQWRHNTPCGQWDVEEDVAHLTAHWPESSTAQGRPHRPGTVARPIRVSPAVMTTWR